MGEGKGSTDGHIIFIVHANIFVVGSFIYRGGVPDETSLGK